MLRERFSIRMMSKNLGDLRVGSGPPTGNMDRIMPKTRKTIDAQAIGIENRPV